jgi:hypothetical protein
MLLVEQGQTRPQWILLNILLRNSKNGICHSIFRT